MFGCFVGNEILPVTVFPERVVVAIPDLAAWREHARWRGGRDRGLYPMVMSFDRFYIKSDTRRLPETVEKHYRLFTEGSQEELEAAPAVSERDKDDYGPVDAQDIDVMFMEGSRIARDLKRQGLPESAAGRMLAAFAQVKSRAVRKFEKRPAAESEALVRIHIANRARRADEKFDSVVNRIGASFESMALGGDGVENVDDEFHLDSVDWHNPVMFIEKTEEAGYFPRLMKEFRSASVEIY